MTMRQKGSRRIRVDGVEYRWRARDNGDHVSLAVERVGGPGQTLITGFSGAGWREDGCDPSITPAKVRRVIMEARRRGWEPEQTAAGEFRLLNADGVVEEEDE